MNKDFVDASKKCGILEIDYRQSGIRKLARFKEKTYIIYFLFYE